MFLLFETVSKFQSFRNSTASDAQTTSNSIIPVEWHFKTANEDVKEMVNWEPFFPPFLWKS